MTRYSFIHPTGFRERYILCEINPLPRVFLKECTAFIKDNALFTPDNSLQSS